MSTHAAIALKMSPTCIRWIYLHCDGDLRFAGRTLANYYLTYEKVRQLILLGDLSSLHRYLEPPSGVEHSFNNRAEDVTVAYHRDNGDPMHVGLLRPQGKSEKQIINELADQTGGFYVYLFDKEEREWLFGTTLSSLGANIEPGKFYALDKCVYWTCLNHHSLKM